MRRLRGIYALDHRHFDLVYGPEERRDIARHVEILATPITCEALAHDPSLLSGVDVIFSGWSGPRFDDAFFKKAPSVRAIFYAGGGNSLPDSAVRRGVQMSTGHSANSKPVAEYTLAMIILSLKQTWRMARECREQRTFVDRNTAQGCYHATVGLVSLGEIARQLLNLLEPFDIRVLAYDPYLSKTACEDLAVTKVDLDEIFEQCDCVSLHTPLQHDTLGLITGKHLRGMKYQSSFINTARGGVVRINELIDVAVERPDLQFILDVTDPEEPPAKASPLYDLPNVILTPHLAGSSGGECRRLGRRMVDELERFILGQPLSWSATPPQPRVTIAPFVKNASQTMQA